MIAFVISHHQYKCLIEDNKNKYNYNCRVIDPIWRLKLPWFFIEWLKLFFHWAPFDQLAPTFAFGIYAQLPCCTSSLIFWASASAHSNSEWILLQKKYFTNSKENLKWHVASAINQLETLFYKIWLCHKWCHMPQTCYKASNYDTVIFLNYA